MNQQVNAPQPPPFAGGNQESGAEQPQQAQTQAAPASGTKKRSAPITQEQIKFVRENVKKMGYTEMANQLGVSKNQVNRILQEIKKGMRQKAMEEAQKNGQRAYVDKEDGKPDYTQPQTDLAQKVEKKIADELSRPADTKPGSGRKGGGQVQNTIQSEVEDLINDLQLRLKIILIN